MARISYSLYLCHGLVVLILKRFCSVGSSLSLVKNTLSWSVVALLTSVFIASLAYRFFEKPMMDLRDRKPSRL